MQFGPGIHVARTARDSGLRDAGKSTPVIVAGNPAESIGQLKQAGVADFVHVRSNAAEVLRAWQERLGVRD